MEEKVYKSLYERPFAEQVAFNIEQLKYRYARLSGIDTDKITLIDIRVVKLNKENTIQLIDTHKGYLWKKGKLVDAKA